MRPDPGLPYAELNLRRNPFGRLDGPELDAVVVADVREEGDAVLSALSDRHGPPLAIQLVGPPGSGKSTLLGALARQLPRSPLVAWSARTGWPPVPVGPSILVDDAHLLPPRFLGSVLRRHAVVVAGHEDLSTAFGKRGFRVRTVDVPSLATPERLRAIVHRRMEAARRGPGPIPEIPDGELRALLDRHGLDLRAVLDALYDRIQRMP